MMNISTITSKVSYRSLLFLLLIAAVCALFLIFAIAYYSVTCSQRVSKALRAHELQTALPLIGWAAVPIISVHQLSDPLFIGGYEFRRLPDNGRREDSQGMRTIIRYENESTSVLAAYRAFGANETALKTEYILIFLKEGVSKTHIEEIPITAVIILGKTTYQQAVEYLPKATYALPAKGTADALSYYYPKPGYVKRIMLGFNREGILYMVSFSTY